MSNSGSRRTRFPSPAMVVACVALAIALSGVGYAAVTIPRGSVGTAQLKRNAVTPAKIRNNAVTPAKIKNNAVTAAKIKNGAVTADKIGNDAVTADKIPDGGVGAADLAPGTVPAGPNVFVNPSGGSVTVTAVFGAPSDTVIRTLTVPAGRYHVLASALVINTSSTAGANPRCFLRGPGSILGGFTGLIQPLQPSTGTNTYRLVLPLAGTTVLSAPGQLRVECNKASTGESVLAVANITAMRVESTTSVSG